MQKFRTKTNRMKAESNLQRFEDFSSPMQQHTSSPSNRTQNGVTAVCLYVCVIQMLWLFYEWKGGKQLRDEKKEKEKHTQCNHDVTKDIYLFGEPEYKQK